MPIQSILRSCKSCKLRSIFLRKTIFICNCQKTFFNNIHTLVFFQILFFLSLSRLINSKFARFYKRCIHAMNWLTGACSHSDIFTYIYIARQRDMSMKQSEMRMHRVDKLEVIVLSICLSYILFRYVSDTQSVFLLLCILSTSLFPNLVSLNQQYTL